MRRTDLQPLLAPLLQLGCSSSWSGAGQPLMLMDREQVESVEEDRGLDGSLLSLRPKNEKESGVEATGDPFLITLSLPASLLLPHNFICTNRSVNNSTL